MKKKLQALGLAAMLLVGSSSMAMAYQADAGVSDLAQGAASVVDQVKGQDRGGPPADMGADRQESMQAALATLVSDSVITQAQADQVIAYLQAQQPPAPADSGTTGTNADSARPEHGSPFAQAVTDGIITQVQADAIMAAQGEPGQGTDRETAMSETMTALVADGTMTQADVDALNAYMEANRPEAPGNATAEVTGQERPEQVSPLQELVDQNIITEAQVQAIMQAMPHGHGGPGGPNGPNAITGINQGQ